MGQSTSYVTLDKLAILTDPALQDRTIPSTLAPQRIRPAPCTYEDLKRVDLVLVSHK
jgi:N-acyl-phosphatidylethanolamine-hydrolysing phospholipase D